MPWRKYGLWSNSEINAMLIVDCFLGSVVQQKGQKKMTTPLQW